MVLKEDDYKRYSKKCSMYGGRVCHFMVRGCDVSLFPFIANELVIGAVGFAGLLVIITIVICICRIIDTIRKSKLVPAVERLGQCNAMLCVCTLPAA